MLLKFEEIYSFISHSQGIIFPSDAISTFTINSLKVTLDQHLIKIETARKNTIEIFEGFLKQIISDCDIEQYIRCHFTEGNKSKKEKCTLCMAELNLIDYEKSLFNVQYNTILSEDDDKTSINVSYGEMVYCE